MMKHSPLYRLLEVSYIQIYFEYGVLFQSVLEVSQESKSRFRYCSYISTVSHLYPLKGPRIILSPYSSPLLPQSTA